MSDISDHITAYKKELGQDVCLVAVSKTKPESDLMEAYHAGQRVFGENKIQEMTRKYEALPKDIDWHMIGHVQTNKVKYMASYVSLVHAVHKLKLLKEINKRAQEHDRTIDCLLQIKIAEEDSKYGMTPDQAKDLLKSDRVKELKYVNVRGLMGMATFTENKDQIEREFSTLDQLFLELKDQYQLDILSMGMSGDYNIALKFNTNMVRIGSSIFGKRNYN
jgi:pyridoxal phosphate enzyme (YggS family)